MNNLYILLSPLDQFEVIDLFSLNANLLGNIHLSLTNIGLYLLIGAFLILTYSLLASNENKIIPNNWSISQESIYATMHSTVVSQINPNKGQIYFPFIYSLFIFILVNNLIGMVKRCLFVIINSLYVCTAPPAPFRSPPPAAADPARLRAPDLILLTLRVIILIILILIILLVFQMVRDVLIFLSIRIIEC